MFCDKGVLRNFVKFTGKHLCQSLFFNKVAGLRPATLFQKRLWHRRFPVNFAKFLTIPFLTKHLRWLPLSITGHIVENFYMGLLSVFKPKNITLKYKPALENNNSSHDENFLKLNKSNKN